MATGPFGTMINRSEHQKTGVPVLGIENIGRGNFIKGNKIFVTPQKAEKLKSFILHENDVIVSRSGTVGELCLVPIIFEGSILSTNLMRVRLSKIALLPKIFVYFFYSNQIFEGQILELCKGSTRIFLNQRILKQILIPLPPLAEQYRIAAAIESAFADLPPKNWSTLKVSVWWAWRTGNGSQNIHSGTDYF